VCHTPFIDVILNLTHFINLLVDIFDFEFLTLIDMQQLKRKFPDSAIMELPKKHFLGNLSQSVIDSRQVMLETFLKKWKIFQPNLRFAKVVRYLSLFNRLTTTGELSGYEVKLATPNHLKKM
jgi:hypothetical protein